MREGARSLGDCGEPTFSKAARSLARSTEVLGDCMSGKLIELKFKSPHQHEEDGVTFIACGSCRNKTYTLVNDYRSNFPLMKCAACGQAMGRMGWYHDDSPEKEDT